MPEVIQQGSSQENIPRRGETVWGKNQAIWWFFHEGLTKSTANDMFRVPLAPEECVGLNIHYSMNIIALPNLQVHTGYTFVSAYRETDGTFGSAATNTQHNTAKTLGTMSDTWAVVDDGDGFIVTLSPTTSLSGVEASNCMSVWCSIPRHLEKI
jgi:hypothetical protein